MGSSAGDGHSSTMGSSSSSMGPSADDELFNPPKRVTDLYVYRIFKPGEVIHMPRSDTEWEMGPIQQESDRDVEDLAETSALCIATQVRGPSPAYKAVMKIKIQLIPWLGDEMDGPAITHETFHEIRIMGKLTKGNCSCTPHLIGFWFLPRSEDHFVPGGYISIVLMEKVPGCDFRHFGEFPLEKRNRVRIAFAKTIREFHRFGLYHTDRARRNIIWDEENERCFIVDLESVDDNNDAIRFNPCRDYTDWCLNSPT